MTISTIRILAVLAGLCWLGACSGAKEAAPPPDAAPEQAPDPEKKQPAAPPRAEEPVLHDSQLTEVTGPPAPSPSPAGPATPGTPAFDSAQWNSAVGLGGGAGGKFGGRAIEREPNTESYAGILESGFFDAAATQLSTFAADVDTASYANVRRLIGEGRLPPRDAVRVEEIVNAMDYRDPAPVGDEPFAVTTELGPCPWQPRHHLLRIGLRTRPIAADKVPPCNLVFLMDVSGSMRPADKLPLLQRAMALLVDQLRPQDRVAIVTYASGVKVPLQPTAGDQQERIHEVLQNLQSGGSTNGQGGIQQAYELAIQNRIPEGNNRVILCTDGDFNVGIRSPDELEQFIQARRDDGVFLTVLGVGGGNLKDDRLERLANRGNGVYAYLDSLSEGRRVLVEQFGAAMMTVAKDVKLQLEFDPARVAGYRLVGYENRTLTAAEFRDDRKDAGELGAGHTMTALYEIVPVGVPVPGLPVDAAVAALRGGGSSDSPIATLRLRYKPPLGETARERSYPCAGAATETPSRDHRLAAAAAAFGMLLRGSPHLNALGWDGLAALLDDADLDAPGLRALVDRARTIDR